MCGLAGFMMPAQTHSESLRRMVDTLAHRGPDSHGFWSDPAAGIWLGHRRLSILDLSQAGNQPMVSASGRYVIAFNGEIYNHLRIRAAIPHSPPWRGHSDTETLLAAFDQWGIRPALERTVGMFALALWDKEARTLTLARDRIGEKPLYYGWQGSAFLFGSEIKALRAHASFRAEIDRQALHQFFHYGYVPSPLSIYRGIFKLSPGSFLTVSLACAEPKIESYWSAPQAAATAGSNPFIGDDREAVDQLETLLRESVKQQMVADVPTGAFLSGGIDSSTVVALMQSQSTRPVKTFSIGFQEEEYNEAKNAKDIATYLGTEHTELYVTPDEAMGAIFRLPFMYDEPFGDASQIPTYLVSKLAGSNVKVSLSGDGGDELFGGYNRHLFASRVWPAIAVFPLNVRRLVAALVNALSTRNLDALIGPIINRLPARYRIPNIGDRIHKSGVLLGSSSPSELYEHSVSHWGTGSSIVLGMGDGESIKTTHSTQPAGALEQMMLMDFLTYLPDDILVKLDRAAMSVSLETRVPFLDHRIVEFAYRLPPRFKIRGGSTKWILRQVLYRSVPRHLVDRPKSGFTIPINYWLRNELRDWAEALLDPIRIRRDALLSVEAVNEKWTEHLSGRRNWQPLLWDVLMFQLWFDSQSRTECAAE